MAFLQTRGSMERDKATRAGSGLEGCFCHCFGPWLAAHTPSSGKEPVEEVKLTSHQRTVDQHVHKDKAIGIESRKHVKTAGLHLIVFQHCDGAIGL